MDGFGSTLLPHTALKYWADPNAKDGNKLTPLHIAAEDNNVIVIKLLLDFQADSFAQDNKGNIPTYVQDI